jgi:hypothetical protein
MTTNAAVGAVAGLWRFPLKSMRSERLEQAEFTERGLVGDRAYALIDADTGKTTPNAYLPTERPRPRAPTDPSSAGSCPAYRQNRPSNDHPSPAPAFPCALRTIP